MAKKKKSKTTAVAAAERVPTDEQITETTGKDDNADDETYTEEEEEGEEESELELLQVDVGDLVKVKQILDETVAGTLLDVKALAEDHTLDNVKLIIMTVACAFAVVAQFSPIPFPESRYVLGLCCCVYFFLSGLLQVIATFWDRDCIMITKPIVISAADSEEGSQDEGKDSDKDKAKPPTPPPKNAGMMKYGLRIRTNLPRFSEFYTVRIEFQNVKNSPFVKKTWSVGQFFDVDGMFDEEGLMEEVDTLYKRFENEDFDKEEDEDETAKAAAAQIKKNQ